MVSNIILIASGQCGNQVSNQICSTLYDNLSPQSNQLQSPFLTSDHLDGFFRQSSRSNRVYPRLCCFDTEPKVIHDCMTHAKQNYAWNIDPRSVAYRHGGAGNNWALGYQMCCGDFLETCMNTVRREIELCDTMPILCSVHSMAGGTGSGLGSKFTECLQDEFHDVTRSNLAILPYHFGEVVVQNYNAILSLATISEASHGVILFENDNAVDLCHTMKAIDHPSLLDINEVIANNFTSILLPKYDHQSHTLTDLADDITSLCSHPGFKILDIKSLPQTSAQSVDFTFDSWSNLVKSILRMQTLGVWSEIGLSKMLSSATPTPQKTGKSPRKELQPLTLNKQDKFCTSLGVVMTLRGIDSQSSSTQFHQQILQNSYTSGSGIQKIRSKPLATQRHLLTSNELIPPCFFEDKFILSPNESISMNYNPMGCNHYKRSASVLSNSQAILPVLQYSMEKATTLFEERAYLHQYDSFGVHREDFELAFQRVGQIIQNYQSLGK